NAERDRASCDQQSQDESHKRVHFSLPAHRRVISSSVVGTSSDWSLVRIIRIFPVESTHSVVLFGSNSSWHRTQSTGFRSITIWSGPITDSFRYVSFRSPVLYVTNAFSVGFVRSTTRGHRYSRTAGSGAARSIEIAPFIPGNGGCDAS